MALDRTSVKITTADELDRLARAGCQMPGCQHEHGVDPMYLHARCHISAPLHARYDPPTHTLSLLCVVCGQSVVVILVGNPPAVVQ